VCFTINNWTTAEKEAIKNHVTGPNARLRYAIVGEELAASGTPHLQGYAESKANNTLPAWKKVLPRAHIETRRGTAVEASAYCKKDGLWEEWGTQAAPGRRTDLDAIRAMITEGQPMREIASTCANYQCIRAAESLYKYMEARRSWKTRVLWLYGPTGCNKSRFAAEAFPDAWWSGANAHWWQGYDGDETVILDDWRMGDTKFTDTLRMLDRYPYVVECKGGSRQLLAKTIVITTTTSPHELVTQYGNWQGEDIGQLIRRVDLIHDMTDGRWPPHPWPARKYVPPMEPKNQHMEIAEVDPSLDVDKIVDELLAQPVDEWDAC